MLTSCLIVSSVALSKSSLLVLSVILSSSLVWSVVLELKYEPLDQSILDLVVHKSQVTDKFEDVEIELESGPNTTLVSSVLLGISADDIVLLREYFESLVKERKKV